MSYFDDNEDHIVNKSSQGRYNNHLRKTEFVEGFIQHHPESKHTPNGKFLSKTILECEDEVINLVAWEDNAEILNNLSEGDKVIVDGYRKYNDFLHKEEFVIKEFIKRN